MERVPITDLKMIKTVNCTTDEQETTINISRKEDLVQIWSSDNTMITRLCNVVKQYPDTWKCYEGGTDNAGNVYGYFFTCPKKAISFRGGIQRRTISNNKEAEE